MSDEEIKRKLQQQLIWEKARRDYERGRITKEQMEAQRPDPDKVVADMAAEKKIETDNRPAPIVEKVRGELYPRIEQPYQPDRLKGDDIIAKLKPELRPAYINAVEKLKHLEKAKAELSNQLGEYPKDMNLEHLTKEILSIRDEWMRTKEVVNRIVRDGVVGSVLLVGTPTTAALTTATPITAAEFDLDGYKAEINEKDRLRLYQDYRNMVSLRSKKEKQLKSIKDVGRVSELKQRVAELNMKIAAAKDVLGIKD